MPEILQVLNTGAGGAVLLVALVVITKVLWTDRRADERTDDDNRRLRREVAQLRADLEWERDRRRVVETTLLHSGLTLPPEPPRPSLPTLEEPRHARTH